MGGSPTWIRTVGPCFSAPWGRLPPSPWRDHCLRGAGFGRPPGTREGSAGSTAQVPNPFVKIVAEDNTFDTDCLQAPPDRNFRIYLENRDADPHNISIYSADPADGKAEQLYKGKPVKGPGQEEYAIEGLPPGKYYFQDDKVPDMNGTIQIRSRRRSRHSGGSAPREPPESNTAQGPEAPHP